MVCQRDKTGLKVSFLLRAASIGMKLGETIWRAPTTKAKQDEKMTATALDHYIRES